MSDCSGSASPADFVSLPDADSEAAELPGEVDPWGSGDELGAEDPEDGWAAPPRGIVGEDVVRAPAVRRRLSLEDRYRGGIIHGAPRKTTDGGHRVSSQEKVQLWRIAADIWKVTAEHGMPKMDAARLRVWAEETLVRALAADWKSATARCVYNTVRDLRRVFMRWMAPRCKEGQCRRAPAEQEAAILLSIMEVLLGTYVLKHRRVEYVWTRYLGVALQHKVLLRPRGVSLAARAELRKHLDLAVCMSPEDVLYFVIPRKGRWYAGRCKATRKRGEHNAPGTQVRMVEHLAGALGAGADRDQKRYKSWRVIGVDAILFLPIVSLASDAIKSLEEYVISRESPGANRRGRGAEKKARWDWLHTSKRGDKRPPQWKRPPQDARSALGLNFWNDDEQVLKATSATWKAVPEGSSLEKQEDIPAGQVHESRRFVENFQLVQAATGIGPVDLYGAADGRLLVSWIAGNRIPVYKIQSARMSTTALMAAYCAADNTRTDHRRQTVRAKVSVLLKFRGVKNAGIATVNWEDGSSTSMQKARKTVERALKDQARSATAAQFWASRLDWRIGKPRTAAQGAGGKNMRKVALEWDAEETREMDEVEKVIAKTMRPIRLVETNCHVRKLEPAGDKDKRNAQALERALSGAGCPSAVRMKVEAAVKVQYRGDPEKPFPPPSPEHVAYVEAIRVEPGQVACGLDRNPKGMAIMDRMTYFCFMEDLYDKDPRNYRVVTEEAEKKKWLRQVEIDERVHRPPWIPKVRRPPGGMREQDLGFEYMNSKEKCLVWDAALSVAANAPRYLMACPKGHSHVREVAVQAAGPVGAYQSAARSLGAAQMLDPGFHLETRGLHLLGQEIRLAYDDLKEDLAWRDRCRRCKEKKEAPGGVLVRADVSQMFKAITRGMARGATNRLLRRVEVRYGCRAFWERKRGRLKPTMVLVRKEFRKRGQRVWSFTQLRQMVEWSSTQVVSRVGQQMLVRIRGQPMGATMSPIKCAIAISECERRGWSNVEAARRAGYVLRGEAVTQVVNGKRLADDVTVASKLLCANCVCKFLRRLVYKAPLKLEVEEIGQNIGVGDLELQILRAGLHGEREHLDVFLRDKNAQFLVGAAPAPPRIRWEPFLGYQTGMQCTRWLTGRFFDIVYKNKHAVMAQARTTSGVIEAAVEMLALSYPLSMVKRAIGNIRNPGLERWRKIVLDWVKVFVVEPIVVKALQDAAWRTRVSLGLC